MLLYTSVANVMFVQLWAHVYLEPNPLSVPKYCMERVSGGVFFRNLTNIGTDENKIIYNGKILVLTFRKQTSNQGLRKLTFSLSTVLEFQSGKSNGEKVNYREMFEIQKSGNKTRSEEISLDIRTHARPKKGQDQVSGGVGVLCWYDAPVAYFLWKPCTIR